MITRACEAAQAAGESHVLLVGDEAYFGRVGFARAPGRHVVLPGPVDQDRVLVRRFADVAVKGMVTPR
jgi:predicted N-acetyltransferase YhbS